MEVLPVVTSQPFGIAIWISPVISQIAVHNVGQGKLTLMDHNEEYICTFPSAYGRSILTVPWVELGGKVSITCPQTNYHANIEFKCKQFFSSDVNKVRWDQLIFKPQT